MAQRPDLELEPREGVRTFTPRWRTRALTDQRLEALLPARAIPPGRLGRRAAFGRTAPVVLEIGSGHGAAAIAYAVEHPEADVVAVDVHLPGVARMLAAAARAEVTNLWVHVGDALPLLTDRVEPGALSAVHLFFPDPWPKNRHAKRRFVQQHTLDLLASRLRPGGILLIATDIDSYARHCRRQLQAHGGYDVIEGERPRWRPDDGFEAKGLRHGRSVSEFRCTRRD